MLASNQFLMCSPQSGPLRNVHGVTQRREEGGRRQRWPGGEKGESKGERQIQPAISSLSVLHSLEHTKRFTELGREEKGRAEEIEATLWRKRRSKMWREQSNQWSHSQVKMGTEDWVLKGTKFDNKYQKAKIKNLEYWLDSQKYDIKKTVEYFPKMGKEIVTQVQETQRVPNRINSRWNTPRHILIKLTISNTKNKY